MVLLPTVKVTIGAFGIRDSDLEFTTSSIHTAYKPIGIQLAVTGSKSIINYGANMTIKYNEKELKEYFDIVNIDY